MGNRNSVQESDEDREEEMLPLMASDPDESAPIQSRKRRRSKDSEGENEIEVLMKTPKRMKMKSTSRYIYEHLFEHSEDSDVTVKALGREWKLHKLYLCQSGYFKSMFSGSWKESNEAVINIDIPDPQITADALHIAFGSLYKDEISVEPSKVVSILAAATLLQLEGLIETCSETMAATVNIQTLVDYYEAAKTYGEACVETACMTWLRVNLLTHLPGMPKQFREISGEMIKEAIDSSSLMVMQTEFSVYVLLRLWLYLQLHPDWDGRGQDAIIVSHRYFQERAKATETYFLDSPEGRGYVDLFRKLRLNHLINHHMDVEMLVTDKLIPESWMAPVYRNQWQTLLRVDQGIDQGPQSISEEAFEKNCLRCGRTLNPSGSGHHTWRWTGFNMGLDIIVTYENFKLSIKRNLASTSASEHEALLDTHKKRRIYYKISYACLNEQKQIRCQGTTGLKFKSLGKFETEKVLKIRSDHVTYPLLLSFNFLVTSPPSVFSEALDEVVEEVQAQ